jgi:CRP-like cAMP-binding protein
MSAVEPKVAKALEKLTHGMDEAAVRHLCCLVCLFELKNGEVLIKGGDHSASMFIVAAGTLRVYVGGARAGIQLPDIRPGEWVGEISMLDPGPASAAVKVIGRATVLDFSHDALKDFIKTHPAGALHLLTALARDLARRLNRTSDGLVQKGLSGLALVDPPPRPDPGVVTTLLHMLHR